MVFFNPISAFAETNLIIALKLTVYLFSKKLGTDHITSKGGVWVFPKILVEGKKKSFSEFLSYNLMLNSGKKIRALCDKKKKYYNSHVVRNFFSE
jgi:hypothetical protein